MSEVLSIVETKPVEILDDTGKWPREALRTRYASCDLTLAAFAIEEGMPYSTAMNYANGDDWNAARSLFRKQQAEITRARILEKSAATEIEIDEKAHRAAVALGNLVAQIADTYEKANAEAIADKAPPKVTLNDAAKLKSLGEAVEQAWKLARSTAHLTETPIPSGLGFDASKLEPGERDLLYKLMKKAAVGTAG